MSLSQRLYEALAISKLVALPTFMSQPRAATPADLHSPNSPLSPHAPRPHTLADLYSLNSNATDRRPSQAYLCKLVWLRLTEKFHDHVIFVRYNIRHIQSSCNQQIKSAQEAIQFQSRRTSTSFSPVQQIRTDNIASSIFNKRVHAVRRGVTH
jgi:hypothetical protein